MTFPRQNLLGWALALIVQLQVLPCLAAQGIAQGNPGHPVLASDSGDGLSMLHTPVSNDDLFVSELGTGVRSAYRQPSLECAGEMGPCSPGEHAPYSVTSSTALGGQHKRALPIGVSIAQLNDFSVGEFGIGMGLPSTYIGSAFRQSVAHVLRASASPQVCGVDTLWIIARVADTEARRYGASVHLIGEAVSKYYFGSVPGLPVPEIVQATLPLPALALGHLFPETRFAFIHPNRLTRDDQRSNR